MSGQADGQGTRVAAASAAWTWYPTDAQVVRTEEYLLVRFPDWFASPCEVLRLTPHRPTAQVVDEVVEQARALATDRVAFWSLLDAPDDLDALLTDRGAVLEEHLDVLAMPLRPGRTDAEAHWADVLDVPDDLALAWVEDLAAMRDYEGVNAAVFGGSVPPTDRLEESVAELLADVPGGSGRVLARLEGWAVATGGLSVARGEAAGAPGAAPVARLWGGGVVEPARGRGAYRAVLAARLAAGERAGCDLALVKGRVETSGPVLRRAGFVVHGQERLLRLDLA